MAQAGCVPGDRYDNMIQQLKARFDADDRAVSPVIGVIIMVAITVILAAVIASMTLGLGDSVGQTGPQASFNVDAATASNGDLTLNHEGGDALHSDRTRVVVTVGGDEYTYEPTGTDTTIGVGQSATFSFGGSKLAGPSTGAFNAYSDTTTTGADHTITSGETVKVKLIDTESQTVVYEGEVTAQTDLLGSFSFHHTGISPRCCPTVVSSFERYTS